MKEISSEQIKETFYKVISFLRKTTKRQIILVSVLVVVISVAYIYGKNLWNRYVVSKQAQNIVNKIVDSEKKYFKTNGTYTKNILLDKEVSQVLKIKLDTNGNDKNLSRNSRIISRRNRFNLNRPGASYDTGYSGDFYIEIDADNTCLVLKYKKSTPDKTVYYASFEDQTTFCQGKKCLKQSSGYNEKLCYIDGMCFPSKQNQPTEQKCGGGRGIQTRECTSSCEGGTCKPWSNCICEKGFEWDGKTCKQLQTEKDCTPDQCFNGAYCEDSESIKREIENGSCTRLATCQKNKGWQYSPWKCSCKGRDFCSVEDTCVQYPGDKDQLILPNNEGSCTNVRHRCVRGRGWTPFANNCVCNKVGTFWDSKTHEAKCQDCTNKPDGAIYTSSGKSGNDCSWKCEDTYKESKGRCLKQSGQYLCVNIDLQICTDEFSKNRKIKKDTKTNEGQPCFVEDQDNVLFYNQKERNCQICQCVDLTTGKVSN
ncbi:MAG: hypothetical protein J5594_03945 [Elusimicrobiaceae bacterium]|nr:hypothetical protein [Elusimicrobiaceae bacterium]